MALLYPKFPGGCIKFIGTYFILLSPELTAVWVKPLQTPLNIYSSYKINHLAPELFSIF
jgi:hypothetical protein